MEIGNVLLNIYVFTRVRLHRPCTVCFYEQTILRCSVFIVVTMNDCTSTRFGSSSHISDSRRYKLNSIHLWKCAQKIFQWVLSCNPKTVYTASGKGAQKRLFVLVQGLKKLHPAVFKQLLTIDIFFRLDSVHIGCGILPKASWQRPRFFPLQVECSYIRNWEWCNAGLDHHWERKP